MRKSFRKYLLHHLSGARRYVSGLPPKEREYKITKLKGAVFIMQIGDKLKSGIPHDGRAPDYDDWSLNGDIIVYYPVLDIALELSSMGIRVDENSLEKTVGAGRLPGAGGASLPKSHPE